MKRRLRPNSLTGRLRALLQERPEVDTREAAKHIATSVAETSAILNQMRHRGEARQTFRGSNRVPARWAAPQ